MVCLRHEFLITTEIQHYIEAKLMECKRYERSEYLLKVFGAAFYKKVQKKKKKKKCERQPTYLNRFARLRLKPEVFRTTSLRDTTTVPSEAVVWRSAR